MNRSAFDTSAFGERSAFEEVQEPAEEAKLPDKSGSNDLRIKPVKEMPVGGYNVAGVGLQDFEYEGEGEQDIFGTQQPAAQR